MVLESPYAGLYYCEKCKKTKPEKEFYGSNNLEKYPNSKIKVCKLCATMHIDNWDPNTYCWLLQECDVPYVPEEWNKLMQRYAKDAKKVSGATIMGRYLSKMHLAQYKDYRWQDTEFLQALAKEKIASTMKLDGTYTAAEITQAVDAYGTDLPEKPIIAEPEPDPIEDTSIEDDLAAGLTDEDKTYLRLKWGKTYRPEEWIQLEKLYSEMFESFDIQNAAHIDTLKLICKTSLKSNQLLDLGDVDGAQKMVKMYDSLMKSGHFTAAQNKEEYGEAVNSVGELVALCEKEGFIPRYYTDEPQDKIDRVIQDLQGYTRTLIIEEMNLGPMIEKAAKQIEQSYAERELNDNNDDLEEEDSLESELFNQSKENDTLTTEELMEFIDYEDELAEEDEESIVRTR